MYLSWPNHFSKNSHPGPGFTWSTDGYVKGKDCVEWNEPADNDGWNNNFLCSDLDSNFETMFTNHKNVCGWDFDRNCVSVDRPNQGSDESWGNNYFCARKKEESGALESDTCGYPDPAVMGCGWTLVRHKTADNKPFEASDDLVGTDIYGIADDDPTSDNNWSIQFNNTQFDQYLIATSNYRYWGIITKESIEKGVTNHNRTNNLERNGLYDLDFIASSDNSNSHTVSHAMYHFPDIRMSNPDCTGPHISLRGHLSFNHENRQKETWVSMYREAKCDGSVPSINGIKRTTKAAHHYPYATHSMNIFIRNSSQSAC